jgi:hypothetical protein
VVDVPVVRILVEPVGVVEVHRHKPTLRRQSELTPPQAVGAGPLTSTSVHQQLGETDERPSAGILPD